MFIQSISSIDASDPRFRFLKVVRSGGFAGLRDTLEIASDLEATVDRQGLGMHSFTVDAETGEELMHAAARLAARGDVPPGKPKGADTFFYAIELGWGDQVVHICVEQLAADEALHGVIAIAGRLLNHHAASIDAPVLA